MTAVVQEEETGCGIAAVATIVQQSYSAVKLRANELGIFAEDKKLFSETSYVRRLLHDYEVETSEQESIFESWDKLPDLALLATRHHEEEARPFWHWVVFHRKEGISIVLDSASHLENNVRTDFDTITPKWYIEILDT